MPFIVPDTRPIPSLDLEQELESVVGGPNLHLRGVALRIRALRDQAQGENSEVILSLLEASEADLLHTGDPIELAKTRSEMARIKLTGGDRDGARYLALLAWEGLSGYGRDYFPNDLVELLEIGAPYRPGRSRQDLLDRFIDLIDEYAPNTDRDEQLSRLIASTSQFFGAERGGLFWFADHIQAPRPVLRASYNLNNAEVMNKSFHAALSLIFKTYRSADPRIIRDTTPREELKETRQAMAVFCLPISLQDRVRAVLYLDNFYTHEESDNIDRNMVLRVSRHLSITMERIIRYTEMLESDRSQQALAQTTREGANPDKLILGRSPLMQALLVKADQAAATDANVLITGETGAGKELLARRIHENSMRKYGPFAVVDLSSIPEALVESELFGHEKGAFTGADRQRPGRVELADKGTLFIDEIGDIPLNSQVKLLRVLQEKSFMRIGGTKTISSDFRLVVATNRDLPQDIVGGRFRQDLYYRLNVLPLALPNLRERGDDIILLAQEFLEKYARKYRRTLPPLNNAEIAALKAYAWPGNVRELKNIMERCAILSSPDRLDLNLPAAEGPSHDPAFPDQPTMDELQRRYIRHVLALTGGRISGPGGAAEVLGMKRTTLQARMRKLKIKLEEDRSGVYAG
ncbi:MAG: sigma-54-dependent Fis family transcriptional regulator [Syntrophales bacterium]|nr:sigma-54-dependent Fis family transcriptional regulator [Syntrophales bacterium]